MRGKGRRGRKGGKQMKNGALTRLTITLSKNASFWSCKPSETTEHCSSFVRERSLSLSCLMSLTGQSPSQDALTPLPGCIISFSRQPQRDPDPVRWCFARLRRWWECPDVHGSDQPRLVARSAVTPASARTMEALPGLGSHPSEGWDSWWC